MLANVLMNIKHPYGDFKNRNDDRDCFNNMDWKSHIAIPEQE
jgi:hypothetical protein